MANELAIRVQLSFSKGGAKTSCNFAKSITVTGDAFTNEVQAVGTTEEELTQGADLGTLGWVFLINLDATNYVQVGKSTGVYTIKMKAGEPAFYRHDGTTVYAKADTATCNVQKIFIED